LLCQRGVGANAGLLCGRYVLPGAVGGVAGDPAGTRTPQRKMVLKSRSSMGWFSMTSAGVTKTERITRAFPRQRRSGRGSPCAWRPSCAASRRRPGRWGLGGSRSSCGSRGARCCGPAARFWRSSHPFGRSSPEARDRWPRVESPDLSAWEGPSPNRLVEPAHLARTKLQDDQPNR
jgi:hypothetical protein